MIVKILPRSTQFAAVKYNFDKVLIGQADLLCQRNFNILDGYLEPKPIEFMYYLQAISKLNPSSKYDQYHVVISPKGKEITKEKLRQIAEDWIEEMGYYQQPYLIFFHHDTENNHVHIVSTDVRVDGSKISHKFNFLKAQKIINRLTNINPEEELKKKLTSLLSYRFTELASLKTLLKRNGYINYSKNGVFKICRYGQVLMRIRESRLSEIVLKESYDQKRVSYIMHIIKIASQSYSSLYTPVYHPLNIKYDGKIIGYTSPLSIYLKEKFNIELYYHFKNNLVTGFTVIDHQYRQVIPGEEIFIANKRTVLDNSDSSEHIRRGRKR